MMAPEKKKIQIRSSFNINSENLYQKTVDHNSGEVKEVNKQEPHQFSKTTTITSNPAKYEAEGTEPTKTTTEGQTAEDSSSQNDPAAQGYDTSQL
jgi:hypothetical protein